MSTIGIVFLLERLSEMNEGDAVILKSNNGEQVLKAAGILEKLSLSKETCNDLVGFLAEIISREAGASAADKCEQESYAFLRVLLLE